MSCYLKPRVLITGAGGFLGSSICCRLSSEMVVIGQYLTRKPVFPESVILESFDINDSESVGKIVRKHCPDIVIHCAGIAHQKAGLCPMDTYMRVNSLATEDLARKVVDVNPDVKFVFLSSVSVYGEHHIVSNGNGVNEDSKCYPSGAYAQSKADAEKRLVYLYDKGILKSLDIFRLAPVYDKEWSFNLERRVFAPNRLVYLRFGSGTQRMSALARPNLVEFILYMINDIGSIRDRNLRIINVSDLQPYMFNQIISVFRDSGVRSGRPVIPLALSPIWVATRLIGFVLFWNRQWWHACYDKLAGDVVFDNSRMLQTGFYPRRSLENIFRVI